MAAVSIQHKRSSRSRSRRQPRVISREISGGGRCTQPLTCRQEVHLIDCYLGGILNPRTSRTFAAHLKACPDCVAFLATYRKTIEITGAFLQLQSLKHKPRRLTIRDPTKNQAAPVNLRAHPFANPKHPIVDVVSRDSRPNRCVPVVIPVEAGRESRIAT